MLRIERLDLRIHDRERFDCGEVSLNHYLRRLAGQHLRDGIATTQVLVDEGAPSRILGFYTLAAAQVALDVLQPADRRRLPRYPVPAARLARLAVVHAEHGHGLGAALLQDAVKRCLALRADLGVLVLVVDALSEGPAAFYRLYGFRNTSTDALTLYLPLGKG
ncbi:MAG: GNAT family N-acetyltransferase [Rhodanobacteraceae bacterium]|nr:MAG: GNAT family N-acetyltransferase [Rhodanobacteraceae bacterium]